MVGQWCASGLVTIGTNPPGQGQDKSCVASLGSVLSWCFVKNIQTVVSGLALLIWHLEMFTYPAFADTLNK